MPSTNTHTNKHKHTHTHTNEHAQSSITSIELVKFDFSHLPAATVEDSSAIRSDSDSFPQQESADDEQNDEEHSIGLSQVVVEQHQQQFQGDEIRQAEDKQTDGHIAMVVSRGSSLDEEQKLMMNVDDESTSPASNKKISSARIERTSAASSRSGRPAGRVDSLIAQMRDIVGGSSSAKPDNEHPQDYEREQPKSSSDSLNNQTENNNSKASIDSSVHKRTRHSRSHCRHHHHLHRHRQSSSSTSRHAPEAFANTDDGQIIQGHHHHHLHHHHRHIASAHRQHAHDHPHHHHHHHCHQQERRGMVSRRSSIQRPSLALIDPTGSAMNLVGTSQKKQITRDSHSSMSSVSSTAAQHYNYQVTKQCRQSNPSQSTPNDSKSSETHSDEKNIDDENARQHILRQQALNSSNIHHGHHHHHHHHHCHHRSHKKRLVLENMANADNLQKSMQNSSESQMIAQFGANSGEQSIAQDGSIDSPRCDALQDLALETKSLPSGSGLQKQESLIQSESIVKHNVHQSLPHDHHHHHHQHRNPHHHCNASAQRSQDLQALSNDEEQQVSRPHRPHRHHRHCQHHGHHCKLHRLKQKVDSKTNVDESSAHEQKKESTVETVEFDSERQASTDDSATANNSSRRISSVSTTIKASSMSKQAYIDQNDSTATSNLKSIDRDGKRESVVEMEMSPCGERNQSSSQLENCERFVESVTPDPNLITTIEVASPNTFEEQQIESESGRTSQANIQHQLQAVQDSDLNSEQGSNESNQRAIHDFSFKPDECHESNRADCFDEDVGAGASQQNKLVRQGSSSQSSKKSQTGEISRDGQSRSEQLADYSAHSLQPVTSQQIGQPKQIIESSVPSDRRCRLCWCCCCPCSAFSMKEVANRAEPASKTSNEQPLNSLTRKFPSLANVPLEEIRSWGESFDKLMRCTDGRKVFQDFLRCEYSEENILFWTACEDLKKEKDSKSIASKARDIYEDYISILSSKEVSLDSRVRDIINNNIKKPNSNIFDEAQLQIYTLMHRDSYPRFINSAMYKKLAQIPSNMSRKSSS